MDRLPEITPGDILREELLEPLGITPYRLAKDIGVPQTRIEGILDGKRAITPDTALRLGRYFGTTPQFWLNLQADFDLRRIQSDPDKRAEYVRIQPRPRPDLETQPDQAVA